MRLVPLIFIFSFSVFAGATTIGVSDAVKSALNKLEKLGVPEAIIFISYSLGDDCQISELEINQSDPKEIFTTNLVQEIISLGIGPLAQLEPPFTLEFSRNMESHMIRWPSTEGREFIECFFDNIGNLTNAEFVHPSTESVETVPRVKVNQPLSSLGRQSYGYQISTESL